MSLEDKFLLKRTRRHLFRDCGFGIGKAALTSLMAGVSGLLFFGCVFVVIVFSLCLSCNSDPTRPRIVFRANPRTC